jgi:hypothetical protein
MRRLGVLLCAVLMFTAATGSALAEDGHGDDHHGDHPKGPPPANVAQAKLCLHNGWKTYVRDDLTPFKNVVACVVYALKGGVLTTPPPPKSQWQLDCERLGGTFITGDSAYLFGCSGIPAADVTEVSALLNTFTADCRAAGGRGLSYRVTSVVDVACNKP